MEINNKFLEILQKIGELDIVEEARNTLLSEVKDLRDKVFNNLTDTKEEDNKEHDAVNHPRHYTSHLKDGELIIHNISEISLNFKENILSLHIK